MIKTRFNRWVFSFFCMGLLDDIKEDIADITSNSDDGYGVELTFTTQDDLNTAVINGLHTKHHLAIDAETGKLVNTKNAHASFSEQLLVDQGYPVRGTDGLVRMKGDRVAAKDSTGTVFTYIIREAYPDETIGFIVIILGEYE